MPGDRFVEVAIDAPGAAGEHGYTYRVPEELGDLRPGEAVLVEFGRRQALGIVLEEARPPEGVATKPVAARVRTDGPLLPPVTLELVREVARTYLAPVALVIRAALPPGLLERLELVVMAAPGVGPGSAREASRAAPGVETPAAGATGRVGPSRPAGDPLGRGALLDRGALLGRGALPGSRPAPDPLARVVGRIAEAAGGAVAVRRLPWDGARAALIRELRALEADGHVRLEWRLSQAASEPRFERRIAITEAGRERLPDPAGQAGSSGPSDRAGPGRAEVRGRPLGSRQLAVLAALAGLPAGETLPAAPLAAEHGSAALASLGRRGLVVLTSAERPRLPLAERPPGARGVAPPGASPTGAQAEASRAIAEAIRAHLHEAFLVDGVTGGGRTAVYAAAIAAALDAGRSALLLVPEIALATPLVDRIRAELGVDVALLHGGLSDGERADEWRRIATGSVRVVVGTRMAALAPVADPGIIVVDEEHDAAYKSDRTPRYQARDVALALGRIACAPVVLGSATPDVATYGRAVAGQIRRITLPARPAGRLPDVSIIDLRAELATGNRGLLSRALVGALAGLDRNRGDRAILIINRRGSASVVLCRDCGYVQVCPECRRPLVYHAAAAALRCHHCGATAPLASRCPACRSPRIRYLGGGTERVEREVRLRFPAFRVGRLDRDVMARRGAAEQVIDDLRDGRLDVLVGTGLVAKGIDVPEVTLVGVVSADIALNLPDARAAERTYQLLVQAVGRAGRGERPGRALVQTYQPDHPGVVAVASGDPAVFYAAELSSRRAFGLPPFGRLVKLTVALEDRDAAESEARRMAVELRERAGEAGGPPGIVPGRAAPGSSTPGDESPVGRRARRELSCDPRQVLAHGSGPVEVLGPVPAYVARRGGRWRFHLVLRGADPIRVLGAHPGPPWSVDVDPESLL